jgi:hypothetical protein
MVPAGRVVVVTAGAGMTVSVNACGCDVVPALSLTVTLKLNGLPAALVGVPLIAPVETLSERPGGNDPAVTVHAL